MLCFLTLFCKSQTIFGIRKCESEVFYSSDRSECWFHNCSSVRKCWNILLFFGFLHQQDQFIINMCISGNGGLSCGPNWLWCYFFFPLFYFFTLITYFILVVWLPENRKHWKDLYWALPFSVPQLMSLIFICHFLMTEFLWGILQLKSLA